MDTYSMMGWLALILFTLLSAFGAAAQEAITPINQARLQRLEDEGMQRAKAIDRLLEQSEVIASTLLLLNTLAIAGATAAAAALALFTYGGDPLAGALLALLLVIGLLFAQMVAKTLAVRAPRTTARVMERPVQVVKTILAPVVGLVKSIAGKILRTAGLRNGRPTSVLNEEVLSLLLGTSAEEEGAEQHEHAMIHRIIELEDKSAHEIMVPRIDIFAVEADAAIADFLDEVDEAGYSRVPVYEESIDNIIGILYVKDLLRRLKEGRLAATARELVRPAYFIPESKRIDELLHDLRQTKVHIAIVVDEYGGTAGLVTIEDLLEEIVGEIQDEYDTEEEEERIQVLGEREVLVDAGVSIDEVNRLLELDLEANGYDTLGGYVYHVLGKMPQPGDHFDADGVLVTVLSTEGRRIGKVRIEKIPAPGEGDSAPEGNRLWQRGDSTARSR